MVDGTSKAAFPLCYPAKGRAPLKVGASKSSPSMHSHVSWRSDCCGYSLPSRRDLVEPLVYAILSLLAVSICHLFWVLLFWCRIRGWDELRLAGCFCKNRGAVVQLPQVCCGISASIRSEVVISYSSDRALDSIWHMAENLILTHT